MLFKQLPTVICEDFVEFGKGVKVFPRRANMRAFVSPVFSRIRSTNERVRCLNCIRFPENPPDGRETSTQRENTPLEAETHNGGFYHALACANFVQRIPMREEFGHLPKTAGAKTFLFFLMLLALKSKPKPPEGRR